MQAKCSPGDIEIYVPPWYGSGMGKFIANRIKELREKHDWTQERLAEEVKTTHATISRIENGRRKLDSVWIAKFAKVFKCKPADLFEGAPSADPEIEQLVALYRRLPPDQRRLWFQLGSTLVEQPRTPPARRSRH